MVDATATLSAGPALKRSLGIGLLTFYGVGVMVGAGVYVLIGQVAGLAGASTPLAFILAGLAASLTAASFAELAGRYPEAGGSAAYTRFAFDSNPLSLLVGFAVAATGLLSAGAVLQGGVGYFQAALEAETALLVVAFGALLTAAAAWGAAQSLTVAAIFTVVEVLGLLAVVAVAAAFEPAAAPEPAPSPGGASTPPLAALAPAIFLAFFAFVGFEDVVNLAEETRDPARTMPRAILLAFAIVIALYAIVAWAALRVATPEALAASDRPLALVFETAGGPALFIAVIGVAAAMNGVLAQIVMAARVLFSLGRRTPALGWFGVADARLRTPLRATLISGSVVIALALALPLGDLAAATTMVLLAVFALMNIALIRLKRRGPPPPGALDLPLWAPALGAVVSLATLFGAAL